MYVTAYILHTIPNYYQIYNSFQMKKKCIYNHLKNDIGDWRGSRLGRYMFGDRIPYGAINNALTSIGAGSEHFTLLPIIITYSM